ncbi:MAG TPA: sodium-translocating pyrophosphatase [Candidatus Nanoarchaeia archaeon]|nr:sodium-translocating pyrophosphatase [Candidatus Nanoarchaeia archaeon]
MLVGLSVLYAAAIAGSIISLLFALLSTMSVMRQDAGNDAMRRIAAAIREGAVAYLNRQYKTIAVITVILAIVIAVALNSYVLAIAFVFGALLSAIAGYIGMMVSVQANVRTAQAATKGLKQAFYVAFTGGSVTGFAVAGLGLLGVSVLFLVLKDPNLLIGFGFGASLISLFARVGGGIYTKGADVGADLVGKVEKGIPEDDPRNPAVIADNVGDNVGDCAGMAADLFESYTVTMIAAMLLAWVAFGQGSNEVVLPLLLGAIAILASVIGSLFARPSTPGKIWPALNNSILVSAALSAVGFLVVIELLFGSLRYFYAALIGLVVTVIIGYVTEYYTAANRQPVRQIANSAKTGPATVIILGMAKGMESTLIPVLSIAAGALLAYTFGGGFYGVAIAATAMLAMTAIIVTVDAFGPITDNAGGIAEMSKMPASVRGITDPLDAVGNTTKAVTKGFAIGSAGLAALSLFAAYKDITKVDVINLYDANVVVGLFVGGLLPFIFSSLTMRAVGRAALMMVEEVRRQFREIPGLMSGKGKPDYARCVDISTKSAMKELILPGIIAVAAPLLVGFVLGPEALGGLLAGAIVTGLLLAITLTTSGAAWDNAKKYIESGNLGGKGSDAHKAAVVGDTVGDPFKDTSGPALNPLIKVLNTIALLAATTIVSHHLF